MDLCAHAVVFVLHDVRGGEALRDLGQLEDRRREHHPDRREVRQRRLGQRAVLRAQCGLADVAGEHVGPRDLLPRPVERLRHCVLEETLPESDPRLPSDDLRDVAGLPGRRTPEQRAEQLSLRVRAAGRGDRRKGGVDIGQGQGIARRG